WLAGDKIGLAIDLGHRGAAPVGTALDGDHALGGDPGCFLVSLGEALLAHQFGGRIKIATGFHEGFLALHHSGAGPLAQLPDHLCGHAHRHHSLMRVRRRRRAAWLPPAQVYPNLLTILALSAATRPSRAS